MSNDDEHELPELEMPRQADNEFTDTEPAQWFVPVVDDYFRYLHDDGNIYVGCCTQEAAEEFATKVLGKPTIEGANDAFGDDVAALYNILGDGGDFVQSQSPGGTTGWFATEEEAFDARRKYYQMRELKNASNVIH